MGELLLRTYEIANKHYDKESPVYIVYVKRVHRRRVIFKFFQSDTHYIRDHDTSWPDNGYYPNVTGMSDLDLVKHHFFVTKKFKIEPMTIEELLVCENENVRQYIADRVRIGITKAIELEWKRAWTRIILPF